MSKPWHVETHMANPSMVRVVGPVFRQMPECEGGGWYTDAETARLIAAAPGLEADRDGWKRACELARGAYPKLKSKNDTLHYAMVCIANVASGEAKRLALEALRRIDATDAPA